MQITDNIKAGLEAEPVLMSFYEMKQRFPDEWVLVADAEKNPNNLQILSGIVLLHSKDKNTASFEGRKEYCYGKNVWQIHAGIYRKF